MAVNKSVIQGRLCNDPEMRVTPNGTKVTSVRIAWNKKIKDHEDQLFIDITAWAGLAEFVAGYFRKGQEIVVEGELQSRSYTDRDGNKRSVIELKADQAHFCGPKPDGGGYAPARSNQPASGPANGFAEMDSETPLPF